MLGDHNAAHHRLSHTEDIVGGIAALGGNAQVRHKKHHLQAKMWLHWDPLPNLLVHLCALALYVDHELDVNQ